MLSYAAMLFLCALLAAAFGFLALAGPSALVAQLLGLVLLGFALAAVRNHHRPHPH